PHAVAVVHSGGHSHRELAGAAHPALPEARVAGIAHDGARPAAARTGLLQLEEALRDAHLPCATAGVAGSRMTALARTAPVAGLLRLLEGLLRLPVVGIAVRVIPHRQPPVGLLDLGLSRCLRYVQYLVIVALRHLRVLRGLASLVLYLLELRVHHILAPRARARARAA